MEQALRVVKTWPPANYKELLELEQNERDMMLLLAALLDARPEK